MCAFYRGELMGKIESLGKWDAHAALHSALEDTDPEDRVLVLIEYHEGRIGIRSANVTRAEAVHMMEQRKFRLFCDGCQG